MRYRLITLLLLGALGVGISGPLWTVYGQDAERPVNIPARDTNAEPPVYGPYIESQVKKTARPTGDDPEAQVSPEVLAFAEKVASALRFGDDGNISLRR